jgi:hypothetical protein
MTWEEYAAEIDAYCHKRFEESDDPDDRYYNAFGFGTLQGLLWRFIERTNTQQEFLDFAKKQF